MAVGSTGCDHLTAPYCMLVIWAHTSNYRIHPHMSGMPLISDAIIIRRTSAQARLLTQDFLGYRLTSIQSFALTM